MLSSIFWHFVGTGVILYERKGGGGGGGKGVLEIMVHVVATWNMQLSPLHFTCFQNDIGILSILVVVGHTDNVLRSTCLLWYDPFVH